MDDLSREVIAAHGGLDRWRRFSTLRAHLIQGGGLWELKGKGGVLADTGVTVDLAKQHVAHAPFGTADRKSSYTPELVELQSADGTVIEALPSPRASFAGHVLDTPWSDLQLAYFAGCAMWTYLNMPFLLAEEGVEARQGDSWTEQAESWRRLHVRFPASLTTHSTEQTLYIGNDGLIRRHDYDVEIAGNTPGAHYISDYRDVQGIKIPAKRRIYPRQPDNKPMTEMLVVSIDLDAIELG